jgi:hypothetical protein
MLVAFRWRKVQVAAHWRLALTSKVTEKQKNDNDQKNQPHSSSRVATPLQAKRPPLHPSTRAKTKTATNNIPSMLLLLY